MVSGLRAAGVRFTRGDLGGLFLPWSDRETAALLCPRTILIQRVSGNNYLIKSAPSHANHRETGASKSPLVDPKQLFVERGSLVDHDAAVSLGIGLILACSHKDIPKFILRHFSQTSLGSLINDIMYIFLGDFRRHSLIPTTARAPHPSRR